MSSFRYAGRSFHADEREVPLCQESTTRLAGTFATDMAVPFCGNTWSRWYSRFGHHLPTKLLGSVLMKQSRQQRGPAGLNKSRQPARYSRQETKMIYLSRFKSFIFSQCSSTVNPRDGEKADLRRHGRTYYVTTYKQWMSAGRRPSL